jgi:hypothetical protein
MPVVVVTQRLATICIVLNLCCNTYARSDSPDTQTARTSKKINSENTAH